MKIKRLRIFQASGLGMLVMFPLAYLLGLIFSSSIDVDYNLAVILYTLPPIVIGQLLIGYWIGRHVDDRLFLHVFLANVLIVVANYIYTLLVYGILLKNVGFVGIIPIIIAWPTAVWVKNRRWRRNSVRTDRWS